MRTITTTIGLFTLTVLGCGGGSPSTTVDEVADLAGEAGAAGALASDSGGRAGGDAVQDGGEAGAEPVSTTGGAASGGAEEPPATGGAQGGLGAGGAGGGAPLTGGEPGSGGVEPTTGGAASGGAEEPPATGGAQGGLGAGGASGGAPLTGGEPGSGGAGGLDSGGAGGAGGAPGPDCLWQEAVRIFPATRFTWQAWEYVNEVEGECSRCEGPICSELELSFGDYITDDGRQGFNVNVVQNRHFYMVSGCGTDLETHEVTYPSTSWLYWTLEWSGTAWMAKVDRDRLREVSVYCSWPDEELGSVDIPGYADMKTDFGLELADWIETIEWRCPP